MGKSLCIPKLITVVTLAALICTAAGCSAKIAKPAGSREVKASEVIAMLNGGKHVCLDSCIVWGDLDFTVLRNRNRIAASLTQVFVEQSVTFNGCIFVNRVKAFDAAAGVTVEFAHNLSFTGCDFRGEVDFTETVVGGNAFFTGSTFRDRVSLQGAYFRHKKAYFNETRFEGDALFQNAVFAGDANFLHAAFSAAAMFQKTVAGGLMFFGNAQFGGYVDFTYARAAQSIFRYAEFKERCDFGDSHLNAEDFPENIHNQNFNR